MTKKQKRLPKTLNLPLFPEYFFDFCFKSNTGFPSLWEELKTSYGVDFKFEKTGLKFIVYINHYGLKVHSLED